MQGFGRADPIQNLDAEPAFEPIEQCGRKRLSRRHGESNSRKVKVTAAAVMGEQHAVAGRYGEEQRWLMFLYDIVDVLGRRGSRPEDACTPDREGKVQGVAEAVREEKLRDAVESIRCSYPKHPLREQLGADHHVMVQMHTALRRSGTARRIQPER